MEKTFKKVIFSAKRACDFAHDGELHILVEDGIITGIGHSLHTLDTKGAKIIETDLLIPSLIDLNVYPKSKIFSPQNLESLSRQMFQNGYSAFLIMPNTNPPVGHNIELDLLKSLDSTNVSDFIYCVMANDGEKLHDIHTLHSNGAQAICFYSDIDVNLIYRIIEYAKMLQIPLICLANNSTLNNGVLYEGEFSYKLGLPSIPKKAQSIEIAKICELAENEGVEVVFSALGIGRAVELVRRYDGTKSRFYTEVSIHHLMLDESACLNYNTMGKITPPLCSKKERSKLIQAFKNGHIDILTSLQCEIPYTQKDQVFELADSGINNLNYVFALIYEFLHLGENVNLSLISRACSYNQSKIFSLNTGSFEVGKRADFALIDVGEEYEVSERYSPYFGTKLHVKIEKIFKNNQFYNIKNPNIKA